jgi:hypothetical protein
MVSSIFLSAAGTDASAPVGGSSDGCPQSETSRKNKIKLLYEEQVV